jgi:predicted membrane GTPase involved in stress response
VLPRGEGLTVNIIDAPGYADFGGEARRGLYLVDGLVLLRFPVSPARPAQRAPY